MKINIELEGDLGEFIDSTCQEEREWFFNHILTKSNLFLHDNEIGDTIGMVTNVNYCEPTEESERYTIQELEACIENWGLCKVEAPYIRDFIKKLRAKDTVLDN
jgi:hypothetical protein